MCLSGAQMEIASNREGYACDFCFYRTTQQEGFDFRWAENLPNLLCLENLPNILHSFSHPQLLYSPIVDLPTSFWPFLSPTNHSFSYFLCYTTRHKGTRKHREEDAKCLINPHQYPPTLFQQTDIVYTFILFLMLGMNTSIKFYFKEKEDRERIDARRRKLPYSTPLVLHLCRQRFQAWHHLPKALLHQRKDRDRKHNTPALQQ